MTVSDLMITKPGGLSCSEALTKQLPLILIVPVPGQESRNAALLQRMGIALLARRLDSLPKIVQDLRTDFARLQEMKEKARGMSYPEAAFQVARLVTG